MSEIGTAEIRLDFKVPLSPVIPRINPLFAMLDVLRVCDKCTLLCCTLGIVASNVRLYP